MTNVTYKLLIKTSKLYGEGATDSTVSVQLVGENKSYTDWHTLDKFGRDDFEQGSTDEFTIEDKEVGRVLFVRFHLKHNIKEKDLWACDNVIIHHGNYVDEFPLYDWVVDNSVIVRGEGLIPQKIKSDELLKAIKEERENNLQRFAWIEKAKQGDPGWMLPRFPPAKNLHNVPHQLKMEDARFEHMSEMRNVVKFNALVEKLQSYLFPIKELQDYKNLFSGFRISGDLLPFMERWEEDEEQGRQMLNGASPFAISRCRGLPDYCKITNSHVQSFLNEGKSLKDEIKEGRIYIADYSYMTKGLPRNKQYKTGDPLYCADVTALFYSSGDGKFRPIAIQLEPDNADSIFTPKDERYDWMLAKMYFRCADTIVHQWIYHFLWGHALPETAAVAMFRNLSRTHPIYKLVRPHLQHVVVINQFARDVLIFDNSTSNYTKSINGSALARHVFKDFDFDDFALPKLLKKKGLDDYNLLQNYLYRDDATALWNAIKKYLLKVINIYYKADEDVRGDEQIQSWIYDFATKGLAWPDGNTRGCPTSLNSVDELVQFCTIVVFNSAVQHSATHNAMFDLYKFIPNAPGGMRLPIHKRGEATLQRVLDSLPDVTMVTILFGSVFVLTELPEEEVYLGEFPMNLFVEEEPKKVLKEFADDLKGVSDKMKERNKKLEYPYEYLLPENVPTGTTA
uniref:allene oxide synthase-lipoxygenase protein-like n=1 Tax=Styela clava TaxID=7725 RepID=UPI00193AD5DB|nr:allene oxide synthase-lipoxygenase protein-like [Styela clava]